MIRLIIIIFLLVGNVGYVFAAEDSVAPGERLELGFYSRIHTNIDSTTDTLRKKELKKYKTFQGFGTTCRPPIPALDKAKMDETLLQETTYGNTSRLVTIIAKNKGLINTDSLLNLTSCLSETYKKLGENARKDEEGLTKIGMIGIYTDGDTKNSDYDIVADIEKINAILFTEKLDYKGEINSTKSSFQKLSRGENIPSLFDPTSSPGGTITTGVGGGIGGNSTGNNTESEFESLSDLGIGSICQQGIPSGDGTPIENMIDSSFVEDLGLTLAGEQGYSDSALFGYDYGKNTSHANGGGVSLGANKSDFFNTPPCSSNFCIKFKMVQGGGMGLVGGQTYSIESLLDKHNKIMEPIANSNLSAQKHQTNSFKLPFLNITLKNKISGARVYVEDKPQITQKMKSEYTKAIQDKEFEDMRRCAYVTAGLPSDINRANIRSGVGYQIKSTTTSENTRITQKNLGVSNPEDTALAGNCMKIALGSSRESYYNSFSTDLTELEIFSAALINQISSALMVDKKLDTLRSK